jgi:multidrug efflux system membrane fusion protein
MNKPEQATPPPVKADKGKRTKARIHRKPLPLGIMLAIGGGLILIAIVIVFVLQATAPEPPTKEPVIFRPAVEVKVVEPGTHRLKVKTQGQVLPRTQTNLVAEVSGRLLEVSPSMEEGGAFREGDLLFRIDPRDYEARLTAAQADLARAEAELTREKAEAEQALRDWEALGNGGQPSDLVLRKPQMAQAQASLESARAAVLKAETDLERTRITAPYHGRSLKKDAEVGGFVNNFSGLLGTIFATDYAEVRLPLSDQQLAKLDSSLLMSGEGAIENGPEVILSARTAGQLRQWKARIARMEAAVDSTSRLYYAVARVERPYSTEVHSSPLMVGLFVDADIEGRVTEGTFEIPRIALHPNNMVYIIDGDNRLEKRTVQVLADLGDRIIVQEGLQAGEKICMTPLSSPSDGMEVTITQSGTSSLDNPSELQVAGPETGTDP